MPSTPSQEEIRRITEKMNAYLKRIISDPDEARRRLESAGIIGPDGRLTPPYRA
jgi:hypothetical protein